MSEQTTTGPTSSDQPESGAEVDTDPLRDAPQAVEEVLAQAESQQEELILGILTDEEIHAFGGTGAEEGPTGLFFQSLDEDQKRMAALGAMRALTSRGELDAEVDAEGDAEVRLPTPYVAAITLRKRDPHLSLRVVGFIGERWYILRHLRDDLFLREVVTSEGFHLISVVRLSDDEREVFVEQLTLPEGADSVEPPAVTLSVSQAQIEGAEVGTNSALGFLEETTLIGNLIRTPAVAGVSSSMINIQPDGGLVIGDIGRGKVDYHGETVARIRSDWDAWATAFAAALAESQTAEAGDEEAGGTPPEQAPPAT